MIGLNRSRQAWNIASLALLPSLRCASSAKSTIMMPFFLTMPMSSISPMREITLKSMWKSNNARIAPTPADGSVERIVTGWM